MRWIQSENEEYYPDFANSTVMGNYLTKKEEELINAILEKENLNNSLMLDIGGGSGRFAIPLHLKGKKVIVLDSSANALLSLKNNQNNLPIIRGNGEKLPFKSGTFDIILTIETIEYITDKQAFLEECHTILKKDGILIVTILNRLSYKMLHPNRKKRPEFYWTTYNKFKRLLIFSGFDPEKTFGFNWIPANRSSNNSLISYKLQLFLLLLQKMIISTCQEVLIKNCLSPIFRECH